MIQERKESLIQRDILKYLNGLNHTLAFKVDAHGNIGISDIAVCHHGLYIAIEVKRPSKRDNVSKLQTLHQHKVKQALGVAFIATSVQDVQEIINQLGKE